MMAQGHTTELCSLSSASPQDPQLLHRPDEGECVGEWLQGGCVRTTRKVTPILVLAGYPAPGDDFHQPAEGNRGERQGKLRGCGLAAFPAGSEREINSESLTSL